MNQSPNRGNNRPRTPQRQPRQQERPRLQTRPSQTQNPNRPPLTPQQIAARRAYIARRKREIRRNRIILGVACAVILLLLIFLVSVIVRGIRSAFSDSSETGGVDTQKTSGIITDVLAGTDTLPAATQNGVVPGTDEVRLPVQQPP